MGGKKKGIDFEWCLAGGEWLESNNIFTDEECRHVGKSDGHTLETCQNLCNWQPKCTAFNFKKEGGECILRACDRVMPPPQGSLEGFKGYYFRQGRLLQSGTNWMSFIPGHKLLSQLSLPGTHSSTADDFGCSQGVAKVPGCQTQTKKYTDQLKDGVRFLDIRLRHIENKLSVHRFSAFAGVWFSGLLIETVRFLRRNPSETVVISYREEYDPSANTETFEETFDRYLKPNDLVKGKKTPGLYNVKWTTEKLWTANKVPALSEVRGKVVMP